MSEKHILSIDSEIKRFKRKRSKSISESDRHFKFDSIVRNSRGGLDKTAETKNTVFSCVKTYNVILKQVLSTGTVNLNNQIYTMPKKEH